MFIVLVASMFGGCAASGPSPEPDVRVIKVDLSKIEPWLVEHWRKGSGFSEDEAALKSASRIAGTVMFGKLVRHRTITHAPFHEYQLVGYLIKIEKISGNTQVPHRDTAGQLIGVRSLQVGDEAWLFARVRVPDSAGTMEKMPRELLVATGDSLWAAFEQPPEMARTITDQGGLALRWTSGLLADKLALSMS